MLANGYSTKIIADSIGPSGKRLTTWELCYPRMVHAELMTHRLFSRNAASSRAIPAEKMLARIEGQPALPVFWGKNQAGMQAAEELSGAELEQVKREWLKLRDNAVDGARRMSQLGLHKQLCNRPTEPWMFITVILSSTEFENWFGLRDHKDAQPELAWVAKDMREKFESHTVLELEAGQWHLPYITLEDVAEVRANWSAHTEAQQDKILAMISTGRCARVSYLTHDGKRELDEDIKLHDKLKISGHWSPFEHVARAVTKGQWQMRSQEILDICTEFGEVFDPALIGNLVGWAQYRKFFEPCQEMRRKFAWDNSPTLMNWTW